MGPLVISNFEIRCDHLGRYCVNDLHQSAGGEVRHQPGFWLRNAQTQALIAAIRNSANSQSFPTASIAGRAGGTYVCRELVYAYAMWISPEFHLQVIRAYDAQLSTSQAALATTQFYARIPKTLPDALRLAADESERADRAEAELAVAAPKVEALDRLVTASGAICITDAAKNLQEQPKRLFDWLQTNQWIFRRPGSGTWTAYQDKLQRHVLEHKITTVHRSDGSEKVTTQVLVTAKGLAEIAQKLRGTDLH
ncbi:phage antirepressor KilAC domain-containing protein [Burkholderia gladioli]|uniref:phage antirepressor KilAC domain-containing protein n=1 Tax=Burkholderia gladioli TaxID=28095 RepID=UPI00163F83EC|nr:phage antirepressor KilAC domain-containing protein [Burkholderia gladioli]MBU9154187.1 phage antirepressor KilAC domain-containing protein [Burkholderia gladioli]